MIRGTCLSFQYFQSHIYLMPGFLTLSAEGEDTGQTVTLSTLLLHILYNDRILTPRAPHDVPHTVQPLLKCQSFLFFLKSEASPNKIYELFLLQSVNDNNLDYTPLVRESRISLTPLGWGLMTPPVEEFLIYNLFQGSWKKWNHKDGYTVDFWF